MRERDKRRRCEKKINEHCILREPAQKRKRRHKSARRRESKRIEKGGKKGGTITYMHENKKTVESCLPSPLFPLHRCLLLSLSSSPLESQPTKHQSKNRKVRTTIPKNCQQALACVPFCFLLLIFLRMYRFILGVRLIGRLSFFLHTYSRERGDWLVF